MALPSSHRERAGTWSGGSAHLGSRITQQLTTSRVESMSIAPAHAPVDTPVDAPARRVRHQARDAATLMAFSAATSLGVAIAFLALAVLARQA
jgi:hypothetical protein